MTALSEAGDHIQIARLGKEFSDLAKAMEIYSDRESLVQNIKELRAMQADNDK